MNNNSRFSDEEIIILMLNKKEKGLAILSSKYKGYLLWTIMQRVKRRDLAELALQDTLLKAWMKIDSYCFQKGKFLPWLLRIAKNTSIDMVKSKYYKESFRLITLDQLPFKKEAKSDWTQLYNLDVRETVSKHLDSKYLEILELIYYKGYTFNEVAQELGIPLGTVKSRVRKAYKDLKPVVN